MNDKTIYILELENGKWYVGKTTNIEQRIEQHKNGEGSLWTKLYKFVKVHKIIENCDNFDEDKYTLKMMSEYGVHNVRGGTYSTIFLEKEYCECIEKMIETPKDLCHICKQPGHFAKECSSMKCSRCKRNNHNIKDCFAKTDIFGYRLIDDDVCSRCKRNSHSVQNCFAKTDIFGYRLIDDDVCSRCKRNSHSVQDCFAKTDIFGQKLIEDNVCSRCKRNSHSVQDCFAKTDIFGQELIEKVNTVEGKIKSAIESAIEIKSTIEKEIEDKDNIIAVKDETWTSWIASFLSRRQYKNNLSKK